MSIPIAEEVRAAVNGGTVLADRNAFSMDPLTPVELDRLERRLGEYWEDTMLVTAPNLMRVITVGHLKALVRQAQRQ